MACLTTSLGGLLWVITQSLASPSNVDAIADRREIVASTWPRPARVGPRATQVSLAARLIAAYSAGVSVMMVEVLPDEILALDWRELGERRGEHQPADLVVGLLPSL